MRLIKGSPFAWLVSYPRSGSRLLRQVISALLKPSDHHAYAAFHDIVPDLHEYTRFDKNSVYKTHFLPDKFDLEVLKHSGKIIYLVRDPLDVAFSAKNFLVNYEKVPIQDDFIEKFVRTEGHVETWREFGTYCEHVTRWCIDIRCKVVGKENFLLIPYHLLIKDISKYAERIGLFLNLEIKESLYKSLSRELCFINLKKKEKDNTLLYKGISGYGTQNCNEELITMAIDRFNGILHEVENIIGESESFPLVERSNNSEFS